MKEQFLILAYYHFCPTDPEKLTKEHKEFFRDKGMVGRIYISEEGINGQASGPVEDCRRYMEWLAEKPGFENVVFKCDPHHQNIFYKMTVKRRKQLVALDKTVDLHETGVHLSPREWKRTLETEKDFILIDTRNDYETKVGYFEGAELPECNTFREFKEYTSRRLLDQNVSKDQKILMYCTGGIRCEYYSAYLKEEGFTDVYQLDGGVIGYAHAEGGSHWKGKLFVFDDRLVADIKGDGDCIAACRHCGQPADHYYNCANMDCNFLFTCCPSCLASFSGCCCETCIEAPRVRPYDEVTRAPFRKWYHYGSEKKTVNS